MKFNISSRVKASPHLRSERLPESGTRTESLSVTEALESCLGNKVCVYLQVKACSKKAFASGMRMMGGR